MAQTSTRRETSPSTDSRRQTAAPDRSPSHRDDSKGQASDAAPPLRDDTTADAKPTKEKESAEADQPPIQEFPKMIRRSDDSLQIVQNQAEEDQVRQSDQEAQAAHK